MISTLPVYTKSTQPAPGPGLWRAPYCRHDIHQTNSLAVDKPVQHGTRACPGLRLDEAGRSAFDWQRCLPGGPAQRLGVFAQLKTSFLIGSPRK